MCKDSTSIRESVETFKAPRCDGSMWRQGNRSSGEYLFLLYGEHFEVRIGSEASADEGNQVEGSNKVYENRLEDRDREGWFSDVILPSGSFHGDGVTLWTDRLSELWPLE